MPNSGFVWMEGSGCLLPFLIIFNLFFGKLIFNSTRLWLGVEAILVFMFILKIRIMAHRISRHFEQQGNGFTSGTRSHRPNGKIIDIQGQVVEEKEKLK